MSTNMVMAIMVVLGVLLVVFVAWEIAQRRRSKALRERFGPEYEHAVEAYGGPRRAERELATRQKRVKAFDIRPLTPEVYQHYSTAWEKVQKRFVDDPALAVNEADRLVKDLMQARGYPISDFEQRSADISVHHPNVVSHYRAARDIAVSNRQGGSSTEDLRQAIVHYRALFEDLLEVSPPLRRVNVG